MITTHYQILIDGVWTDVLTGVENAPAQNWLSWTTKDKKGTAEPGTWRKGTVTSTVTEHSKPPA
jgi:hypothetical protein